MGAVAKTRELQESLPLQEPPKGRAEANSEDRQRLRQAGIEPPTSAPMAAAEGRRVPSRPRWVAAVARWLRLPDSILPNGW